MGRRVNAAATASILLGSSFALGALPGTALASGGGTVTASYNCNIANPCPAKPAGTVKLSRSGRQLTITKVNPNTGWRFTVVRRSGLSPEVEFRKSGTRVDFEAQVDNGAVHVRVRRG